MYLHNRRPWICCQLQTSVHWCRLLFWSGLNAYKGGLLILVLRPEPNGRPLYQPKMSKKNVTMAEHHLNQFIIQNGDIWITCIAASRMNCFAWSDQMAGTVRTHKMSSDQDESLFSVTLGSERLECVSCFVDTEVSRCSRDVSKFIELSLQSSLIVVFSNKASKWFFRYLIASENTFKAGSFFPFCALSFNFFNFCFVICKKK